jgi:hypothetical protein
MDTNSLNGALDSLDAKTVQEANLPPTIKRLHRDGRLTFDDVAAVKWLLSDLRRIEATGYSIRLGYEEFLPDQNTDEPPLSVEADPLHCALRALDNEINGTDPDQIRAPSYSAAPHHQRKLLPATAPGRLAAARKAVDEEVGIGAFRILCHVAQGSSFTAAAGTNGVTDKTAAARTVLAAKALRRHDLAEARRPPFPSWGAVEPREGHQGDRVLSTPGWRQTGDGKEIVERCARTFMTMRLPQPLRLRPEIAGFPKLIEGPLDPGTIATLVKVAALRGVQTTKTCGEPPVTRAFAQEQHFRQFLRERLAQWTPGPPMPFAWLPWLPLDLGTVREQLNLHIT